MSVEEGIAREALDLFEGAGTVAFGAWRIPHCMAAMLLPSYRNLTFITNSVDIALTLHRNRWERVILSGGRFRGPVDALTGPRADATLRTLNAEALFLEVCGVRSENDLTNCDAAEAKTSRCLVDAAQSVLVVADHTKLDVVALAKIIPFSKIDALVTDEEADAEVLREIELAGVQVVVAEV